MRQHTAAFAILSCALFPVEGDAFSTTSSTKSSATGSLSSSSLNLFPGQGSELVAAYNAKLSSETSPSSSASKIADPNEGEVSKDESKSSHRRALSASKSFLTRVFHIPSVSIKDHPHPAAEGLPREHQEHHEQKEEIVKYPIVGFYLSQNEIIIIRIWKFHSLVVAYFYTICIIHQKNGIVKIKIPKNINVYEIKHFLS